MNCVALRFPLAAFFACAVFTVPADAARVSAADYRTLQAAIDALPKEGGTVYVPSGYWRQKEPLSLRGKSAVKLEGDGPGYMGSQITFDFPLGAIHPARKWPLVDMTGCNFCALRDLTITGGYAADRSCGCGLLMARSSAAGAGGHQLENVKIEGYFGMAALVMLASECNQISHCTFTQFDPTSACVFIGNGYPTSTPAADSPYARILRNDPHQPFGSTMLQNAFRDCIASHYSKPPRTGCLIQIQGGIIGDLLWDGGGFSMQEQGEQRGERPVACDAIRIRPEGKCGQIRFAHIRAETNACRNFLRTLPGPGYLAGLYVEGCTIECQEQAFYLEGDWGNTGRPMIIRENAMQTTSAYSWGSLRPCVQTFNGYRPQFLDNQLWFSQPAGRWTQNTATRPVN